MPFTSKRKRLEVCNSLAFGFFRSEGRGTDLFQADLHWVRFVPAWGVHIFLCHVNRSTLRLVQVSFVVARLEVVDERTMRVLVHVYMR